MAEIRRHKAKIIRSAKVAQVFVTPLGGDPLNQTFYEATGDYIPDRTLVPLTLVPEVMVEGEDYSSHIASQGWYKLTDTGEEQITSSTPGHELVSQTGAPLRLKIKINTLSGGNSKYLYRCTVDGVESLESIVLRTNIDATPGATLEIDAPTVVFWNPFDPPEKDVFKITPTVHAHGQSNLSIRWLKIDDGVARAIDPDSPEDIEIAIAGDVISVDRRIMGHRVSLVCELLKDGVVCDRQYTTIARRIPDFDWDVSGSPVMTDDDSALYNKIVVDMKPNGVIANPSQELKVDWYEGNTVVGQGNDHTYSTQGKEEIDTGVGVADRGPWCLATINGDYITINGAFLKIR